MSEVKPLSEEPITWAGLLVLIPVIIILVVIDFVEHPGRFLRDNLP